MIDALRKSVVRLLALGAVLGRERRRVVPAARVSVPPPPSLQGHNEAHPIILASSGDSHRRPSLILPALMLPPANLIVVRSRLASISIEVAGLRASVLSDCPDGEGEPHRLQERTQGAYGRGDDSGLQDKGSSRVDHDRVRRLRDVEKDLSRAVELELLEVGADGEVVVLRPASGTRQRALGDDSGSTDVTVLPRRFSSPSPEVGDMLGARRGKSWPWKWQLQSARAVGRARWGAGWARGNEIGWTASGLSAKLDRRSRRGAKASRVRR